MNGLGLDEIRLREIFFNCCMIVAAGTGEGKLLKHVLL